VDRGRGRRDRPAGPDAPVERGIRRDAAASRAAAISTTHALPGSRSVVSRSITSASRPISGVALLTAPTGSPIVARARAQGAVARRDCTTDGGSMRFVNSSWMLHRVTRK